MISTPRCNENTAIGQTQISRLPNAYGEIALPYAPTVTLSDGHEVVPQQYLDVVRTLTNLENILTRITLPAHFQLFAGQEGSVLYLLVAIVGEENYPSSQHFASQDKIVYGRRWLIESTTPTSEVVQTALLAVQKVREHELREKVTIRLTPSICSNADDKVFSNTPCAREGGRITTPFNNHQDLPLLIGNIADLSGTHGLDIATQCDHIRLDGMRLECRQSIRFADKLISEIKVTGQSRAFADFSGKTIMVSCDSSEQFAHALIAELLKLSNRYIEEGFLFENQARFSYSLSPFELAEFSYQTRNIESQDHRFDTAFKDMSYRVDAAKAPNFSAGELGRQQRRFIDRYKDLGGYPPLGAN